MLNMRFEGTDTALMVVTDKNEKDDRDGDASGEELEDFEAAFKKSYKSEFGFLLDTKSIIVDDIKVLFLSISQIFSLINEIIIIITIGPGDWQNFRHAWSIRLCRTSSIKS